MHPQAIIYWVLSSVGIAGTDPEPRLSQCPERSSLAEFQAAARAGEQAFTNIDLPALTRAREMALSTLPCLDERVTTAVAADFHRMMAMAAFTAGDEGLVLAEFRAARRLAPGYHIPAEVAPEGHPLAQLYQRAAEPLSDDQDFDAVIPPLGCTVSVDGAPQGLRVRGLSAIVQVFGEDAVLTATEYLLPGDPTPRYGPLPLEVEQRKRRRNGLLAATGASAFVAGGLYTRAVIGEKRFADTTRSLPEPRRAQATNNAFFWGSVGVSGVALGLGVFTVVTW